MIRERLVRRGLEAVLRNRRRCAGVEWLAEQWRDGSEDLGACDGTVASCQNTRRPREGFSGDRTRSWVGWIEMRTHYESSITRIRDSGWRWIRKTEWRGVQHVGMKERGYQVLTEVHMGWA